MRSQYFSQVVGEHLTGPERFHCNRVPLRTVLIEHRFNSFIVSYSQSREPVCQCNGIVDRVNTTDTAHRIHLNAIENISAFCLRIDVIARMNCDRPCGKLASGWEQRHGYGRDLLVALL